MTPREFTDGNQEDDEVINHDGVELSISGSDFEDDATAPDNDDNGDNMVEPGEIESDNEDEDDVQPRRTVASKVVKVSRTEQNKSKEKTLTSSSACKAKNFSKFKHLREDPDFRDFLNEMLDDCESNRKQECQKHDTGSHGNQGQGRSYKRDHDNDRDRRRSTSSNNKQRGGIVDVECVQIPVTDVEVVSPVLEAPLLLLLVTYSRSGVSSTFGARLCMAKTLK